MITTILSFIISASPTGADAIAPNLVETDGGAWMTWIEPVDKEKKNHRVKMRKV